MTLKDAKFSIVAYIDILRDSSLNPKENAEDLLIPVRSYSHPPFVDYYFDSNLILGNSFIKDLRVKWCLVIDIHLLSLIDPFSKGTNGKWYRALLNYPS